MMKQKLAVVLALALSSALLAGCDRPAGTGTSADKSSSSSGTSGTAGSGSSSPSQPKKSTTPGSTTPPPSK